MSQHLWQKISVFHKFYQTWLEPKYFEEYSIQLQFSTFFRLATRGILTGGDDGALGFIPRSDATLELSNCSISAPDRLQKCYHSAHITGMEALDAGDDLVINPMLNPMTMLFKYVYRVVINNKDIWWKIFPCFRNDTQFKVFFSIRAYMFPPESGKMPKRIIVSSHGSALKDFKCAHSYYQASINCFKISFFKFVWNHICFHRRKSKLVKTDNLYVRYWNSRGL